MHIDGLDKGINEVAKEVAKNWRLGVNTIVLVSGKIGTGKTTFQQLLLRKLLENGLPSVGVNFADRLKQYVFLLTGKLKSLKVDAQLPNVFDVDRIIQMAIKPDIELVLKGATQIVEHNGCCWECNKAELISPKVLNEFYGKRKLKCYIVEGISSEIRRKITYALLEFNGGRFDLRKLLQFMGTEVFRETVGGIYWAYILFNRVLRMVDAQPQPQIFVVGDWRFISEYQTINCFIKLKRMETNMKVISVRLGSDVDIVSRRLGVSPTQVKQLWNSHISETELDGLSPSFFNFQIENNSTINFLP